jgi:hypothetical protein
MIEPNIDAETLDEACSDYNDLETRVVNILYILSLNMLHQTPIESMQTSQAALNLANALAVVDRLTKV